MIMHFSSKVQNSIIDEMIQGLLDLYQATFDQKWIEWAVELQGTI